MIKHFATSKNYILLSKKHPNVNTEFYKFCALRAKWGVLAGSKMSHSISVCSAHQNAALLVNATELNLTQKDLIKRYALV